MSSRRTAGPRARASRCAPTVSADLCRAGVRITIAGWSRDRRERVDRPVARASAVWTSCWPPPGQVVALGWSSGASPVSARPACWNTQSRVEATFGYCGCWARSRGRISRSRGCWSFCGRLGSRPGIARGAGPGLAAALGGSGEADRFAVYAATLGVIALLAEAGPLLCVVDDAQWVDPASGDALLFAARRLADDGVLILFGARDGEATFFEARGIPELLLAGLGVEDAGRLARESCGRHIAAGVVARPSRRRVGTRWRWSRSRGLRERQRLDSRRWMIRFTAARRSSGHWAPASGRSRRRAAGAAGRCCERHGRSGRDPARCRSEDAIALDEAEKPRA